MRRFGVLLLLLSTSSAYAIPMGPDYRARMVSQVLPFIGKSLQRGEFKSADGKRIIYGFLKVPQSKGTIVISPGRTEGGHTFVEHMYDLAQAGYSVALIEHRGQGNSARLANTDVGHVEHFEDYVQDFSQWTQERVIPQMPAPYFLWANSMGAAIALSAPLDAFQAAAVFAPMLRIQIDPLPDTLAQWIARALIFVGRGDRYLPTRGEFNLQQKFEGNIFTHSRERFEMDLDLIRGSQGVKVGGPSPRWILEAMLAAEKLRARAAEINLPLLLVQAGKDTVVDNRAEDLFCQHSPHCRLAPYASAYHVILMEEDRVRTPLFAEALKFFAASKPRDRLVSR